MLVAFPLIFAVDTNINYGYNFIDPLIWANSLFVQVLSRSFVMLNTMMENECKRFTKVSISFLSPRSW